MPITLGQDVCGVVDDNNKKCTNLMTHEEQDLDGMCTRCANTMWDWITKDTPVIFKDNYEP